MTREIFEVDAPYKFTFPVEKAESRTDGLYLVGMATGPEVDSQNERVHPTLIQKWADQINRGEVEVVYRDWHQKETSMADLGVLTKAWVDDTNHLGVEVKLDEDHPFAVYIHKSVKKGKQYGMSVFGKVHSYADEYEPTLKRNVRTFYDATLEEVSNTTRPIYTPSFGTVLSKAVSEAATGDIRLSEEARTAESTEATTTETTEVKTETTTDSGAATAPDTGKAPETAADETVEKAVKAEDKKSEKALQGIVKNWTALGEQLKAAGLLPSTTEGSGSGEETTVTKSETVETTKDTSAPDVVTLQKSVNTLAEVVTALADRISDGGAPGLIQKSEAVDPLAELKAEENPIERLRLGLAVLHGKD